MQVKQIEIIKLEADPDKWLTNYIDGVSDIESFTGYKHITCPASVAPTYREISDAEYNSLCAKRDKIVAEIEAANANNTEELTDE